jgi:DNA polymerase
MLTKEEILSALRREVQLLEAEGETTLAIGKEQIATLKGKPITRQMPPKIPLQQVKQLVNGEEVSIPIVTLPDGDKQTRWEYLRDVVLSSPVCNAHLRPGKQIVFGVGNLNADIFFCGEAPGADEETQGEPFVGPAGQLLNRMIVAMGLRREDVYIGNILNWRPEMPSESGNRQPTPEERELCLPFLRAQVEIVQPKVIVALGTTATYGLLGNNPQFRLGNVRGTWQEFQKIPLMVTYHPSYLLRHPYPNAKRIVWEDFLKVMEKIGLPISEKQREYFR